ncbi:CheR family methyltransferase [Massilia sp. METH4]|uniref:CheR family methyltransferase n=1 Tax=Massilia sp. METH4 TaxID=3123041 RepID=UPI0030CA63D8
MEHPAHPTAPSPPPATQPSQNEILFPVVGIGASAGGYAALSTLLQNLPPDPGMALVIILHLPPHLRSNADRVLQGCTPLPVVQVTHTMPILPNRVYVIPPDRSLRMEDGRLVPGELDRKLGDPTTIDQFFRTLAMAHREKAVGVVLSGMGADGTAGLACIKELGGVSIVQLPEDAEERSMPRSAIESGMADFVLTAAQIPHQLLELRDVNQVIRRHAEAGNAADGVPVDAGPDPQRTVRDILALLHACTGHDFRDHKEPTLLRRLERRLQVRGLPDLPAYLQLLRRDASEPAALLKDLLIGVTRFFRDPHAFDALERVVLPRLFRDRQPGDEVRAWVAACSTGEEAYSLAMLLDGQVAGTTHRPSIQVFASDIDAHALRAARSGKYPAAIAADVAPGRLERYFTREDDGYRVRSSLRDQILFAEHNVLRDPAFSRLDLITCRNFLIYLNRETYRYVLQVFHFALSPGGYLMLGSAESAEEVLHLFEPIDATHRIYQARPLAHGRPRVPVPAPRQAPGPVPAAVCEHAPAAPRPSHMFSVAEIHLRQAAALAPPSILVNAHSEILHIAEGAGAYLRHAGGEPTRELLALAPPGLRMALRVTLFQAEKSGKPAATGPVHYASEEGSRCVDVAVHPFRDEGAGEALMLVVFRDVVAATQQVPAGRPQDQSLLEQLSEDLHQTRARLRETIEQAEASMAELRTANEEWQTAVEELRAATEDREAAQAEQLSANEELKTVVHRLQLDLADAARTNDDLDNLITSSNVATLFLDRDMRILRYTPRVADLFNVIPADVGRPLQHITNHLDRPQLADEAAMVFKTLQPLEREARSTDGRDYIVRVHPYRTSQDRIEGAVMTFFDITGRRVADEALRRSEERFRTLAGTAPALIWQNDERGDNVFINRYFADFAGGEMHGGGWHAIVHPDDADEYIGSYLDAVRERSVFRNRVRLRRHDGQWRWIDNHAQPLLGADGAYLGHVGVSLDITDLMQAQQALADSERRMRVAVDATDMGVYEWNIEDDTTEADARTAALFGFKSGADVVWVRVITERIHPEDGAAYASAVKRALKPGGTGRLREEVRLLLPDGTVRWLAVTGQTFFAGTPPRAISMTGTVRDITARKEAPAATPPSS